MAISFTMDEIKKYRKEGLVPPPLQSAQQGKGISFTKEEIEKYRNPPQEPEPQGKFGYYADKFGNLVDSYYQKFTQLPVVKQASDVAGLGVGVAGGVIGGAIGTVGTPIVNVIKGKPVFSNFGQSVVQSTKNVSGFGQELGKTSLPASILGRIPSAIMGASQVSGGISDVGQGDYKRGGAKLATGVLGLLGSTRKFGSGKLLTGPIEEATKFGASKTKNIVSKTGINIGTEMADKGAFGAITGLFKTAKSYWDKQKGLSPESTKYLQEKTKPIVTNILNLNDRSFGQNLAGRTVDEMAGFLLNENVLNNVSVKKGIVNTKIAERKLKDLYVANNKAFDTILRNEQGGTMLDGIFSITRDQLSKKMYGRGEALTKALDSLNTRIQSIKNNLVKEKGYKLDAKGDLYIPWVEVNKIKSSQWFESGLPKGNVDDTIKAGMSYELAHVLEKEIEQGIPDKNIHKMNRILGNYAEGIKLLQESNGGHIPKGGISNWFKTRLLYYAIPGTAPIKVGILTSADQLAKLLNKYQGQGQLNTLLKQLGESRQGSKLIENANKILRDKFRNEMKEHVAWKATKGWRLEEANREAVTKAKEVIFKPSPLQLSPGDKDALPFSSPVLLRGPGETMLNEKISPQELKRLDYKRLKEQSMSEAKQVAEKAKYLAEQSKLREPQVTAMYNETQKHKSGEPITPKKIFKFIESEKRKSKKQIKESTPKYKSGEPITPKSVFKFIDSEKRKYGKK